MINELAAFILTFLFALFLLHVVQGAAGKGKGGIAWFTSFFQRAPASQ